MTGIVVTGGLAPSLKVVEQDFLLAEIVVAADSGLDTLLSYGIQPDFIVGDMDSLSSHKLLQEFSEEKIYTYPEDKDYTDTELAINLLYEKGCSEIVLIGGGGGRMDHIVAIYSLFFSDNPPAKWITHKEKIFLVKGEFCANLKIDSLVSFFPVGNQICQMTSHGLKWPLDDLNWKIGDVGISNVASEGKVEISMKSGNLVMMVPYE